MRFILVDHRLRAVVTACSKHRIYTRTHLSKNVINLSMHSQSGVSQTAKQFEGFTFTVPGMYDTEMLLAGIEDDTVSRAPLMHISLRVTHTLKDSNVRSIAWKGVMHSEIISKQCFFTAILNNCLDYVSKESIPKTRA